MLDPTKVILKRLFAHQNKVDSNVVFRTYHAVHAHQATTKPTTEARYFSGKPVSRQHPQLTSGVLRPRGFCGPDINRTRKR